MITLVLPKEPYWLDLVLGIRVQVRPHNTLQDTRARAYAKHIAGFEPDELVAIGIDPDLAENVRSDDPATREAANEYLYVLALGQVGILAWEDVQDEQGEEAPVEEITVNQLLGIPAMAADFVAQYMAQYNQVVAEKNGSTPAPSGTSVGAPRTANSATRRISPAAGAKSAPTDTGARTAKTSRKRKKAGKSGISSPAAPDKSGPGSTG